MDPDIEALIEAIHDSPPRLALATAGAGSQALAWLLGVGGASRTLLEAIVPYDPLAFDDFLGQRPAQYVAAETAGLLAGRALTRARWLRPGAALFGLGCTATIATDRAKRGEHRAHVATWRPDRFRCYSLGLNKGERDRAGEEALVSRLMLNALAEASDLEARLSLPLVPGDRLDEEEVRFAGPIGRLQRGEIAWSGIQAAGTLWPGTATGLLLLSGSFNPLHDGHLGLAQAAAAITGRPAVFELGAINAAKPPLPMETILDRMAQFAGRWPVLASNAPTFADKARLFPQAIFVVGYDTAVRALETRYYGGDEGQMGAAFEEIRRQGCSFLVAGRASEDGQFHDPADLALPEAVRDLFQPLPAAAFRLDTSSTALRAAGVGSRR